MTDSPEFASVDEPDPIDEVGLDRAAFEVDEPAATGGLEAQDAGEGWSGADIEEAYLKALHAMEELPWEESPGNAGGSVILPETGEPGAPPAAQGASAEAQPGTAVEAPAAPIGPGEQEPGEQEQPVPSADGPRIALGTEPSPQILEEQSNVTPVQVIEAALFVGGAPLTARQISSLLRGGLDTAAIEQMVDELNAAYAAQGRPYEIRLGDGGYRLELRTEFDRLRNRVYGSGPREVRLSQDLLEVLALVAYRQPISQEEIEGHGKQNAGNLLRQLLRRDLVAFERGPGGRKDIRYHTTARFLSVFGLAKLEELPRPEDLARK